MNPIQEQQLLLTRRSFFHASGAGLGMTALASLLTDETQASTALPELPHFPPKAKRVIYLFQHGAPSQLDLFDHKPNLQALRGTDLPESVRMGQRLTGMTAYQTKFPTASSIFRFSQHGQGRAGLGLLFLRLFRRRRLFLVLLRFVRLLVLSVAGGCSSDECQEDGCADISARFHGCCLFDSVSGGGQ
jgi:hypothetical protein